MADLQKSVLQELENSGKLDKFRAQLRALLFETVDNYDPKVGIERDETDKILETETGQICAELIRDFLDSFKMSYSSNVFIHESHLPEDPENLSQLEEAMGVKSEPGKPLLFYIIEQVFQSQGPQEKTEPRRERSESQHKAVPPLKETKPPHISPRSQHMYGVTSLSSREENNYIEEDISEASEEEDIYNPDELVESGGSSMGMDASVNSLAIDEYDHVEPVRRPRNKF